ncbi:NosD domain-containing protein [Methanolobus sp. WCC1]|uniref:right-handed parallel beta-helix repeat-containing protein n=1 Tax=unclassified Methanolobus TaxID=2629569 RepID=UPI00325262FF
MALKYLTITIVLLITFTYTASAATIDIGTGEAFDFSSIQDAIAYSSEGDTILVHPGTYTENVIVNKKLTIISSSEKTDDVILIAENSSKPVIHIVSDCVTINGLKITGSDDNGGSGIYLKNADKCIIKNNSISDNNFAGIVLEYSVDNEITANNLSNDSQGIYLDHSVRNTLQKNFISNNKYGMYLHVSKNNVIDKNEIIGNSAGITQGFSNSNTITNNIVSKNNGGFFLYKSNENQIENNILSSNNEYGILLRYSDSNILENNIVNGSNSGIRIVDYSTNNAIINNCLSENENDITVKESENIIVTSADDNNPDDNNSLVQSCGNIRYVMLLGNVSYPVTVEEINEVTNLIIASYREENQDTDERLVFPVAERSSGTIILAYCFSINENGVTSTYTGKTSTENANQDEKTIEIIHGKAQDWYEKEVVKKLNDTKYPENCSSENNRRVLTPEEVTEIFGNSTWILPDDWMEGKLNYSDDYDFNNYRETSGSIYKQEWIPTKFPLLMW